MTKSGDDKEKMPIRAREHELPEHWNKEMVEIIPLGDGLCLDLGCGECKAKLLIQRLGYEWVGIDIEPNRKITVLGDGHSLPFSSKAFDLVIAVAVLEHFKNPWKALWEVNRVLKDRGIFAGSVAFMEPFHHSFFHFTHLGIEAILKECNFSLITVRPGWGVLEALSMDYFIPLPLIFLRTVMRFIMFLRRTILLTFFKNKLGLEKTEEYLQLDRFRFAGSIFFVARKTKH